METEQRTYGIAEWAAALRARRTEKELAALAAGARGEREAVRRSSPREPEFHPKLRAAQVPEAEWGVATYRG